MVEFACGISSLLLGEILPNVARGIDCDATRQPLGTCAGITPFNFPAMVPLWMYPVAKVTTSRWFSYGEGSIWADR